jgi:hypothetical protein
VAFSGTPVFSTNETERHDITEIILKVALNTINQTKPKVFWHMPTDDKDCIGN